METTYLVEYDIGVGDHHVAGTYEVQGNHQIMGPLPKELWTDLKAWNPFRIPKPSPPAGAGGWNSASDRTPGSTFRILCPRMLPLMLCPFFSSPVFRYRYALSLYALFILCPYDPPRKRILLGRFRHLVGIFPLGSGRHLV